MGATTPIHNILGILGQVIGRLFLRKFQKNFLLEF